MRILGFVLTVAIIMMGAGDVTILVDLPSILIVLGALIWGFTAAAGPQTGLALKAAFSRQITTAEELGLAIAAFRTSRFSALAGGFFAAGSGIIIMLKNLDDPAAVGPGMALALLGIFWSVFLGYGVLFPLQTGMEKRLAEVTGSDMAPADASLDMLVLVGGIVVSGITFALIVSLF